MVNLLITNPWRHCHGSVPNKRAISQSASPDTTSHGPLTPQSTPSVRFPFNAGICGAHIAIYDGNRCFKIYSSTRIVPLYFCVTGWHWSTRRKSNLGTSLPPNKSGRVHPRVNNHQLWTVRMNWRGGRLSWHAHHSLLSPNFLFLTTYLLVYRDSYFYLDWMWLTFCISYLEFYMYLD